MSKVIMSVCICYVCLYGSKILAAHFKDEEQTEDEDKDEDDDKMSNPFVPNLQNPNKSQTFRATDFNFLYSGHDPLFVT